jgi:hypothetical protein
MRKLSIYAAGRKLLFGTLLFLSVLIPHSTKAVGVTIITHGLNDSVQGWVTAMADQIPNYYNFLGTNFTIYEMYFYYSDGYYYLTSSLIAGSPPSTTDARSS